METCKNCGTEFEGNFCPNCGQRPNSGRIIFWESVKDVLQHFFDFDAPLFRTIGGLITNPGKVIKEYIYGKRKSYAHPFRYFVLVLAIYLILKNLIGFNPIEIASEVLGAKELPNPNSLITKGSNFFSEHINSFLLLYAFTIALFSKLFNLKSEIYFVEYLSLGFFTVAEYMCFSILVLLLSNLSPYFFIFNYLFALFYPMYVLVRFHEGKLFTRITKAFFVSILAWFLYAYLGFSISMLIVSVFGL